MWITEIINRCRRRRHPVFRIRVLRCGDIIVPGTIGERVHYQQPTEYRQLELIAEGDDAVGTT